MRRLLRGLRGQRAQAGGAGIVIADISRTSSHRDRPAAIRRTLTHIAQQSSRATGEDPEPLLVAVGFLGLNPLTTPDVEPGLGDQ